MQQDTERKPEGEQNPQPLEGMIEGGQLKQDKGELQKIIDRNKGQVEKLDETASQDLQEKADSPSRENITAPESEQEKAPKNEAIKEISNAETLEQDVKQEAEKGEVVEEKEKIKNPIKENPQPVESFDQEVEIPEISPEKRKEILEGLEGKIEKVAPTKDDGAKDDDDQHEEVVKHASEVVEISNPEQQIEKIVQLAISKDPYHAIKVAQHLDNNYILDKVHDELVEDKVRKELIKKGLLKEV